MTIVYFLMAYRVVYKEPFTQKKTGMNRRYTERDTSRIPCRAFLWKITGAGTHTSTCSAKHTVMGNQCSTYISMVTENFLSAHIRYLAEAFSVHGYPELSTFSRACSYMAFKYNSICSIQWCNQMGG